MERNSRALYQARVLNIERNSRALYQARVLNIERNNRDLSIKNNTSSRYFKMLVVVQSRFIMQ